ncbi:MAG: ATP-binding cassette domain-containing protein [Acidobacteria bacterium]|nr:ATP-binding cassette domain-containing protein [Acidobacteriota bacterium]
MIQLSGLTKSFGDRVLFENVTWHLSKGERVGLCGPNGAGKTTLLRMLAGLEEPDTGSVIKPANLTVGYLPQDGIAHAGRTVYQEAALAFGPLLAIKAEMHELEERLGDAGRSEDEHAGDLARYSDLQDRFRLREGYSIDLKIATVLAGLGFKPSDFDRPTETFSGGWQMRLALAKLLLARPTLLLLDEPTNHLDLDARNWLESFLVAYPDSVMLVSHDRFFLDAVVHRITEVNLRVLTDYKGNYSQYLVERDARMERLLEARRRQDDEIARMRQFIDRFRYQATKAAQVQSRIKMLEKIELIEVPPERKKVHFTFPVAPKSGRTVFDLRHIRKAYGETVVFENAHLHIERGDRVALVGPNGAGKSTLVRLLAQVEGPEAGTCQTGHQVVAQYFAQDEPTRLEPSLTVHDTLAAGSPVHMVPAIRNILGAFLFSGDDVYKRVSMLSGGERTRLAVARMLLHPSNTLLLDEPTNHLDIDSKNVLLDALLDYGGTLILVSHDRYFIEKLATKIIDVGGGQAVLYPGTYDAFLWSRQHVEAPEPTTSKRREVAAKIRDQGSGIRDRKSGTADGDKDDGAADREKRKRAATAARKRDRALQDLKTRVAELETRIAEHERAIQELETAMATPGFYDRRADAQLAIERHQHLMWEVGGLMQEWEELMTGL